MSKEDSINTPADLILEELRLGGISETRAVCEEFRKRKHSAINRGGVVTVSAKQAISENYPFYGPHYEVITVITDSSSLPREQKQEIPTKK